MTKTALARNSILSLTEKFIREGAVDNLWVGSTGTTRYARTEKMVEKAKVIMEVHPREPIHHLSQPTSGCERFVGSADCGRGPGVVPIQDVDPPEANTQEYG